MLGDACCPGLLSKAANAPPLVPMCVASGASGIQGAARRGGQRIVNVIGSLFAFELGDPLVPGDTALKINRLPPARNTSRQSNTAVTPVRHQLEYRKS